MNIKERDLYHGAALTKIVLHKSFKALNTVDDKYGHYQVNNNVRLMAKHSTSSSKNGESHTWQFTFNPDDIKVLIGDFGQAGISTFVVLTCGKVAVCCINETEIRNLVNLDLNKPQGIQVVAEAGKQLRVRSSRQTGGCKIPVNRFPNCIFVKDQ